VAAAFPSGRVFAGSPLSGQTRKLSSAGVLLRRFKRSDLLKEMRCSINSRALCSVCSLSVYFALFIMTFTFSLPCRCRSQPQHLRDSYRTSATNITLTFLLSSPSGPVVSGSRCEFGTGRCRDIFKLTICYALYLTSNGGTGKSEVGVSSFSSWGGGLR
jgi:hypothetical protein